ncbi:MAG: KH domain-containing protein [Thermovirgaceae bacterium]|nr:KH domain-containing protein [Thermovirgaceae bacterium]
MPDYEELVSFVVRNIVANPDEVTVTSRRSSGGGVVNVSIRVAGEDMGRLIGKRGVTINAIRLIAKAAAVKPGEKVDVDILED